MITKQLPDEEPDALLTELRENYNGYRFSRKAKQSMFNTDVATFFLSGMCHRASL